MIQAISKDRWLQAQDAEVRVVDYNRENSERAYRNIFKYLGLSFDQEDKSIAEIGCGLYPAVYFCENVQAIVFEPLFSKPEHCGLNIFWNRCAFEEFKYHFGVDEVWIYNCLQHVIDPEAIVKKSKDVSRVVRFFEPVDYPTCTYHPHTFSQSDFERWFPNSVQRYTDRLVGFFDSDCVYGTWEKPML